MNSDIYLVLEGKDVNSYYMIGNMDDLIMKKVKL